MSQAELPLRRIPGASTATEIHWTHGAWLFRDQTLRTLEFLLDEAVRIPGTSSGSDLMESSDSCPALATWWGDRVQSQSRSLRRSAAPAMSRSSEWA
jgi:hypothetical protein